MLQFLVILTGIWFCLGDYCQELGPSSSCWPCDSDVGSLMDNLQSTLYKNENNLPYDSTIPYWNKTSVKNWRYTTSNAFIIQPNNVDDVIQALTFSKTYGIKAAVLSSGHDYIGRNTGTMTFLIRLDRLKSYTIYPEDANSETGASIIADTGCNWGEIYKAVDEHDLVAVGGAAHGVAMGGWHLGGGHSPMTRTHGLGVDQVISFRVILPDFRIANVSANGIVYENGDPASNDTDLFWALRGGGGVVFGIVLQFKFKLHPAPSDGLVQLYMSFPWFVEASGTKEQGSEVLDKFHKYVAQNLTSNWGGYVLLSNAAVDLYYGLIILRGTISMYLVHVGGYDQAITSIQPLIDDLNPLRFQSDDALVITNYTSFWEYTRSNVDDLAYRTYIVNRLVQKSDLLDGGITNAIRTYYNNHPEQNPEDVVACTYTLLGGQASTVADTETAVNPAFRSAYASLSCGNGWADSSDDDKYMASVKEFSSEFYKAGTGTYMNEPDSEMTNWKDEHWGSNYAQLLAIKQKYDLDNFLQCSHCVGSDLSYTGNLTLNDTCYKTDFSSATLHYLSARPLYLAAFIALYKLLY